MTAPPVVNGLDLSISSTGIASSVGWTRLITTPKPPPRKKGTKASYADRGRRIARAARDIRDALPLTPALVVIEAQFANSGRGQHDMYGLWWAVVADLANRNIPVAVVVDSTLKKYATGNGHADKPAMVAAAREAFPWFGGNDDEADALWLTAMGAHYLGHDIAGVPTPPRDPSLLAAAHWPDMPWAA